MNETNTIWYGYLEAGDKSSPVLVDPKLDTGNAKTVYMYNLNSQRIIEYKREIAEPKLRALSEQEAALVKALTQGYDAARKNFSPRNHIAVPIAAAAGAAVSNKPPKRKSEDIDVDDSLDEFDLDDSDIELEDDSDEDLDSDEE